MISILNSLFYRLRKNKLVFIFMAVAAGVAILENGIVFIEKVTADPADMPMLAGSPYDNLNALLQPSLGVFLAVIAVAVFLGTEYSDGTVRNMLIANKSRAQVYFSFVIVGVTIGAMVYFSEFIATALISPLIAVGEFDLGNYAKGAAVTLGVAVIFCVLISVMTVFFLVATRRRAWSSVCTIGILLFLPTFLMMVLIFYIMNETITEEAMGWLPFYGAWLFNSENPDASLIGKVLLEYVVMILGFGGFGWLIMEKSQLK